MQQLWGNDLPIDNKLVAFDIDMLYRIIMILFQFIHNWSPLVVYKDIIQYNLLTSLVSISNSVDMEWYTNGLIFLFLRMMH